MPENKMEVKEKVMKKFSLSGDLSGDNINAVKTDVRVEKVDNKLVANFSIYNLPKKKSEEYKYSVDFKKIFNNFDEFSVYAKELFGKTDKELIDLCKNLNKS